MVLGRDDGFAVAIELQDDHRPAFSNVEPNIIADDYFFVKLIMRALCVP